MSQHAENIKNILTGEEIKEVDNLLPQYKGYARDHSGVTITIETAIKQFKQLKNILLQSIENDSFQKLPAKMQREINRWVENILNRGSDPYYFLEYQQELDYHVGISGLEFKLGKYDDYKDLLNNISKLKNDYQKTKKIFEGIDEKIKRVENIESKASVFFQSTKRHNKEASNLNNQTKSYQEELQVLKDSIKANEQEIENSKKDIVAFFSNIDSYKKNIEEKTKEANEIIEKLHSQQGEAEKLIQSAEKALKLKSAEGISDALSKQADESKEKKKSLYWIGAAGIFVATAIGIAVWLTISVSQAISIILGRIFIVGIALSAAAFCARQFTKREKIADDYTYKSVLAKSIVAFAEEMKKHNQEKAAEFLGEAAREINRSPASQREEKRFSFKTNQEKS